MHYKHTRVLYSLYATCFGRCMQPDAVKLICYERNGSGMLNVSVSAMQGLERRLTLHASRLNSQTSCEQAGRQCAMNNVGLVGAPPTCRYTRRDVAREFTSVRPCAVPRRAGAESSLCLRLRRVFQRGLRDHIDARCAAEILEAMV